MIVQADDRLRRTYVELVTSLGYAAREARSCPEALTLAREHPALILVDPWLPGLNGFDLIEHLWRDLELRTIPVLALDAEAELSG